MKKNCKTKLYKPLPDYLSVGLSDIHGIGIIAKDDIPAEVDMGISHVYDINFQHNYIRTPLGGFINHSENANCELTIRKIIKGEELTLNYSMYDICNYLF
jgi:hypothetical protein